MQQSNILLNMEHFIVVRNRNINKTFENVFVRFLCVHKNRMKVLKKEPNFGSAKQKYMAVESWSRGNEYNNKMSAKKSDSSGCGVSQRNIK